MWKEFLPLFGILLTALLGVITYTIQERRKHDAALAERRQALYEKLIRDLVDLLIAQSGAERSKLITEIEKGWLFASDKVVYDCYELLEIFDDLYREVANEDSPSAALLNKVRENQEIRNRLAHSLAKIFLAMRADTRDDNRIKAAWAGKHFKIYDWGALAQPAKQKPAADDESRAKEGQYWSFFALATTRGPASEPGVEATKREKKEAGNAHL